MVDNFQVDKDYVHVKVFGSKQKNTGYAITMISLLHICRKSLFFTFCHH